MLRSRRPLWDLKRRQYLGRPVPGPRNDLLLSAFSPDGKTFAFAREGTDIVWDVNRGRQLGLIRSPRNITSMAFSPDGEILAFGLASDRRIILWDVEGGERPSPSSGFGGVCDRVGCSVMSTSGLDCSQLVALRAMF